MNDPLATTVNYTCNQLTDIELAMLNNFVQMDIDPREQPWYDKVKPLFTESSGSKAHTAIKEHIAYNVLKRL